MTADERIVLNLARTILRSKGWLLVDIHDIVHWDPATGINRYSLHGLHPAPPHMFWQTGTVWEVLESARAA